MADPGVLPIPLERLRQHLQTVDLTEVSLGCFQGVQPGQRLGFGQWLEGVEGVAHAFQAFAQGVQTLLQRILAKPALVKKQASAARRQPLGGPRPERQWTQGGGARGTRPVGESSQELEMAPAFEGSRKVA